jgi:glycerol-3-phosphate dehydrogenase
MLSVNLTRDLDALEGELFDLAIIGGGITGAGIARHAAAAGLRTALVEANDFASGTSSRSTKLIHGGLRYLAMGDVGLVRESLLERANLRRMAPHLVEPRWMVLPVESWFDRGKFQLAISAYEWLGKVRRDDRQGVWNSDRLAQELPDLDLAAFSSACVYREYLTDDARLVLANLRSAVASGATVANYLRVTAIRQGPDSCELALTDGFSARPLTLRAQMVVNAAGPWVETLLPAVAGPSRLQLSKGVHLVVPRARLPLRHMVVLRPGDGRMLFAIPRGEFTYIGTTDSAYTEAPSTWPRVKAAELDYLLAPLARYFPGLAIAADDIVGSWAGLRPLINQPGKAPKEMSRKDEVWVDGRLLSIAGGKLTGYRKMAEEVMAAVGDRLRRPVAMPDPLAPLPGGEMADAGTLASQLMTDYQLDSPVAQRLVRLYGAEAPEVLRLGSAPLSASVCSGEVEWAVTVEGARTLEDLVYRRLGAAWFRRDEIPQLAPAAAARMAQLLGWSESQREQELSALQARLAGEIPQD